MMDVIDDAGAWLETQLQTQKAFLHGLVFMLIAIGMRWGNIVKPEDTVPLSKVTFQLMLPAIMLTSVANTTISFDLWRVAVTSMCTHAILVTIVVVLSRFVSKENGLRGQWMLCMMGCNIGFTYPILLSVPSLARTVFPVVLVWDLCGNLWVVMVVDYIVAIQFSPLGEESQPLKDQNPEHQTSSVLPSTVGALSDNDVTLRDTAASADIEGGRMNEAPGGASQSLPDSPLRKSMSASAFFAESVILEAGVVSHKSAPTPQRKHVGLRGILLKLMTNIPFVATLVALLINKSGSGLPTPVNDFLHNLGQPFSVLFFFLVGLNVIWSVIRPRLGEVAKMLVLRVCIHAFLAAGIWISPFLPDPAMRHGALFGLCCPVSGMVMSYVIDLGYSRGLQAAIQTCTNAVSLVILCGLLSMA
eukprot:gnl/MRDRNA2_/MRDRNA2_114457_c0_seq1.p1 gnl/MRDRNA2_/MRDRNA2_114457_c0~~gnl/MRDRNA2_/MRDRNA2_114457_c0_seq1.p1  ORF type:complete len:416 (+),score=52.78 gnl/MRDRNA2_/MRDRNA2_114457_c0_seq1:110-1357(+)